MKKSLGVLVFLGLLFLGTNAHAWKPGGWAYMQWPAVYSIDRASWMYLDPVNYQWNFDYNTSHWSTFGAGEAIDQGWIYFQWPFAYSFSSGHWYYINESDQTWAYSFANGQWSKLGALDPTDLKKYVDTILGLLSGSSYTALTDQVGTILGSVVLGSDSTCPKVTVSPTITDLNHLASPTTITVDYGAGCTPNGSTSAMSGSATLTITDFTLTNSEISANYSLSLNNLAKGGVVLGNGTISGSFHAVVSGSVLSTASITMNFNASLLQYPLSGQIAVAASNVDLSGSNLGPITITFNNFSLGATQISNGTVTITTLSQTSTQVEANLTTNDGPLDLSLLISTLNSGSQIEVATTQTGTIGDYSIEIGNVTWDSTICSSYPASGSITLSGDGTTSIFTFTGACDGTYTYTEE